MFKKIGFIGIGLIGGSIARAVHRTFPDCELLAYDTDKGNTSLALEEGVIQKAFDTFDPAGFSGCELIFLCTPVFCFQRYLSMLKDHVDRDAIITDVGSVKGDIFEKVEELGMSEVFIGGHPMAGTEKAGFENSLEGLLKGATYVLMPTRTVSFDKVSNLTKLVEKLGARVITLSPHRHDYAAAAVSHVPHILSYALMNLIRVADSDDNAMKLMAAGGLRDMTRIASSPANMWKQICLTNRENIIPLLSDYINELTEIKKELQEGDGDTLFSHFESAMNYRREF